VKSSEEPVSGRADWSGYEENSALGVLFLFFVAFDRFLKILDAFANALSHFGEPLSTEQEKNENGNDQKFRYA